MKFAIYDKNLKYKGLLTDIINADWVLNYQQANTFVFEFVNDEESNSRNLLQLGYFIYEKSTDTMMYIEKIKYSDIENKIYAYGYGAEQMLSWRIIKDDSKVVNAEQRIREYLDKNKRGLIIDNGKLNNFSDVIEESEKKNSELLNGIYDVCKDVDFDIIVKFNARNKRFTMDIVKVRDKTYKKDKGGRVFSADFGNIGEIEITLDNLMYKNKAYCEINNVYIEADVKHSDFLREIYLSSPIQKKDGENDNSYRSRSLEQIKKDLKKEHKIKSELEATILNDKITEDVRIGDRITCKSEKYKLTVNATVSSISIKSENGIEKKSYTFSDIENIEKL